MGTVQAVTEGPEAATNVGVKQQIAQFMTGFTPETTPGSAAKIADYREHLRPGTVVYVTFLPGCGIAGVHMYPLGGLRRSAKWRYAVTDGAFTMNKDGKGFTVDIDLG